MNKLTNLTTFFAFLAFAALAADSDAQIRWLNPGSGNWNTGSNWDSSSVPTATDDVIIDASGSSYTVTTNTNPVVNQLTMSSADANLNMVSRTFESTTGASITAGRAILSNSTWNGGLISNSGHLYNYTNRINTVNLNGGVVNNVGGLITVRSWGSGTFSGRTTLNVENGLDNSGDIVLSTSPGNAAAIATLDVKSGTLTNQVDGMIEAAVGENAGSHARFINALNLVNHGSIVNNDASELWFNKAGSTISNTGTIDFAAGDGRFAQFASLNNQAGGMINGNAVDLIGQSSTTATINNSGTIDIDTGDLVATTFANFSNSGTIDVSGGNMSFTMSATGNFSNSGWLKSAVGRSVGFVNGMYTHNAGGQFQDGRVTFTSTDLVLNSDLNLGTDSAVMTNLAVNGAGKLVNNTVNSLGVVSFNTQVENNGTLGVTINRINTVDFNAGLTNGASGTLQVRSWGSGTFSGRANVNLGSSNLVNHGTVSFQASPGNASAVSNINFTTGALVNYGTIEFLAPETSGGVGYAINGELINYGSVLNFSGLNITVSASNANHQNLGRLSLIGGDMILQGSSSSFTNLGLIDGINRLTLASGMTLVNQGEIAPGASPGELTIAGNVDLDATSLLSMEIGGLIQGDDFDHLLVLGNISLDGTLDVELFNDFSPAMSDQFTILTASSISGQFSNVVDNQLVLAGGVFDVSYGSTTVILSNFQAVPEPAGLPLLLIGVMVVARRRR